MNLPVGLIAAEHAATIFTAEAKMIHQAKVIDYKGNEEELTNTYQGKTLPKTWVNQLYFEVETIEDGVSVIYGRGRSRAMVVVIKIDDERRWCTIQYIAGKQRTVLLGSCKMEHPHLVPIHFSCYGSIHAETKVFYGDRPKGFKPNYLVSDAYEAIEYAGVIYAFRKGSPIIDPGSKLKFQSPTGKKPNLVKNFDNIEFEKPPEEKKDGGIINTHWADKATIRMLEAKRDIIDVMIEQRETKIFESENPDK